MGVFLAAHALERLKDYKYSSVDRSIVSRVALKPFYSKFILLFPKWMAPNLITLLGLGFVVINLVCILAYNPTFDQECPTWVYVSCAVGLFMYQTFDACDGLQARRTGQSGPLGELFDHCCDAVNTTLEVLIFCAVVNTGYTWAVVASQFATLLNFYLSTWEEYHTGTLFLSEFSGPVEGILLIIAIYLTTAVCGPAFWHQPRLGEYSLMHLYLVFAGLGLAANVLYASLNVQKAKRAKKELFGPAAIQNLPFIYYFASLFMWYYVQQDLVTTVNLLAMVFGTGITVALVVGQIISAHLTKQAFPGMNPLLLGPTVGVLVHFVSGGSAYAATSLSWVLLGASLTLYSTFVYEVIHAITGYLNIGCLYIKHKKE